ncbi:MAG: MBL fold metallo-hydrolase [Oscillospiraceae bacterium]|nr:MBL fold metallo-hydrolase [Oscillospiraceae bacterium]
MKNKLRAIPVILMLCILFVGCGGKTPPSSTAPAESPLPAASTLNVWCFQAGKAGAFLFWNEDGTLLIDKGESGFGKTVLEKLTELEIEHPDYLLITHFDKDHLGGAKNLKSRLEPYCKATAQRKARRLTKGMSPPWRTAASSR